MRVRSLAYRTDLMFPAFDGSIVDRGDYLVVTTPSIPKFPRGNFVLFPGPPRAGDLERWTQVFRREIGEPEHMGYAAFGIDGTVGDTGEARPFLEAGYELDRHVVMTARSVRSPERPNQDIVVRPIESDEEWEATVQYLLPLLKPGPRAAFEVLRRGQMARYRSMAAAGRGHWYGAFMGKRLVADLGVFHEDGVGRYQTVRTHLEHRGRGIAGTMVHAAAEHTLRHGGVRDLVIVAEDGSQAERIYRSLGFAPVETALGLTWERT